MQMNALLAKIQLFLSTISCEFLVSAMQKVFKIVKKNEILTAKRDNYDSTSGHFKLQRIYYYFAKCYVKTVKPNLCFLLILLCKINFGLYFRIFKMVTDLYYITAVKS